MGSIKQTLDTAFRDYEVAGDPASGVYEPEKAQIRALGPLLEYEFTKASVSASQSFLNVTAAQAAQAAQLIITQRMVAGLLAFT